MVVEYWTRNWATRQLDRHNADHHHLNLQMDHIDIQQLKTGEVDLGVRSSLV